MKERLQGIAAGILIGAIGVGGAVYARTGSEWIEAGYNNIKIYKDNVSCEMKDVNGNILEPFIYNGTTYMPVRGAAELAGMMATWDGETQSVYLWDNAHPDSTYLIDACPPFETSSDGTLHHYGWYNAYSKWHEGYTEYSPKDDTSFAMSGIKYTNGFTIGDWGNFARFNLGGKYSEVELTVRLVDEKTLLSVPVKFYLDGEVINEMTIEPEAIPRTIKLPVSGGYQLRIVAENNTENNGEIATAVGFGNITVK